MNKNPDEILAERIFVKLLDNKLLGPKQIERLRKSYNEGKMTAEDWNLLVEAEVYRLGQNN